MIKACEDLIVMNLTKISQSEQGSNFLKDLPAVNFTSLCSADNLYIEHENIVVHLIEDYLKHREGLPLLEEELPKKDYSILTEEEKKKREEEENKKQEEEKKKSDEEEKKQADEFAKLDDLGKIQHTWTKKSDDYNKECDHRLTLSRLTKD